MRAFIVAFFFLAQAASTFAAPSFQIVTAGPGIVVAGSVSADGSTVLYTRATSGAAAALFDVETGQHTAIISSPQLFGVATSGDGSIVHGNASGELFEFSGGSLNVVGPSSRFPAALSDDGMIGAGSVGGRAARTTGGISGTTVLLDDLTGGGTSSFATDISADGSVVVGAGSSASGTEAFRWEGGLTVGLGDLAGGGFESRANGVSADGLTVVGYGSTAAGREAFRWRDGNMISLGDLAGGSVFSEALGVSGDGSVVVGRDVGAGGQSEAFIWDPDHGMRRLEDVFAELAIDLQLVDIDSALGISSDGRTLVGTGFQSDVPDATYPGGVRPGAGTVVWVAVIPEPGAGLLIGLGLMILGARPARAGSRCA